MSNPFTQHPKEVGMTYPQHFLFALSVTAKLVTAVFCCLVHAFFPFLFTTATSTIIRNLHQQIGHRQNNDN